MLGRNHPPLKAQVRLSHQEPLEEPSTEWQAAAASLLWLDYLILAEGPSIYFHPLIYLKKKGGGVPDVKDVEDQGIYSLVGGLHS